VRVPTLTANEAVFPCSRVPQLIVRHRTPEAIGAQIAMPRALPRDGVDRERLVTGRHDLGAYSERVCVLTELTQGAAA
jgi:hypothetical protein